MQFETDIRTIEQIITTPCKFIIPIYQRPYVWNDDEIKKLLEDILATYENNNEGTNYFVGNIYVVEKINAESTECDCIKYELVDGQQRFTTFWLIAFAFRNLNITSKITQYLEVYYSNKTDIRFDFDIRTEVSNYLKNLLTDTKNAHSTVSDNEFLKYIAKAIETIRNFITSEIPMDKRTGFGDFIYSQICFVFNLAPKNTDLNSLFTALGTSGIQLQQSDILKARLLDKVSKNSRIKYAKIWEACEDMSNYFEKNVADIFNINRTNLQASCFKAYSESKFSIDNLHNVTNTSNAKTIKEIVNSEIADIEYQHNQTSSTTKCRSIISFNVLLIHTYRIFNILNKRQDFERAINPKSLLATIKPDDFTTDETEYFFELLWKVRYLFDKHVVKWRIEEESEELLLTVISTTTDKKNKIEKNYLSRQNASYSCLQMLQSVLYFTGGFTQQYWLTPFLYFLLKTDIPNSDDGLILNKLEEIDNYMLPGDKKESSLTILSNDSISVDLSILDEAQGTSFNHYWFYKLEYILWKAWKKSESENKKTNSKLEKIYQEKMRSFKITSKNSIEHVFPQTHEFGKNIASTDFDWLNSFGNLGLLSIGENSSYSNQDVKKKKVDFDNKQTFDSLKLAQIYSSSSIDNWNIESIKEHQNQMIQYLKKHYEKTQ